MNIRKELGELIILQTFAVLMKENPLGEQAFRCEAEEKVDEIAGYVKHLEEGLHLIANVPDSLGLDLAFAQSLALLALGGPKEEE